MRTTARGHFDGALIQQLERLFHQGTTVGLSEGELVERFASGHDESAFEALIARHGPMVLGVCRQLLRDPNDVDDAFQATFLVLVRKAGTLRRCDLLGNWLYGVAYRVATRARVLAARRTAKVPHGQEAFDRLDAGDGGFAWVRDEASGLDPEPRPWLHEEVGRLPEKYRVPVVLCYFEGLTHDEAARRLGCPIGTVKGRLSRARDLLRKRLTRRGMTLSAAGLASLLAIPDARAAVPASLEYATLKAAQAVAGGAAVSILTVSAVSIPVAALTDGVLQSMIITNVRAIALPLLVLGAVTTGVVIGATQLAESTPPSQDPSPSAYAKKVDEAQAEFQKQKAFGKARGSDPSSPIQKAAGPNPAAQPAGGAGVVQGGRMGAMAAGMEGGGLGGDFGDESGIVEFRNRLGIARLAAGLNTWDKNPKNEAILLKLDEPIAMSFANETPLQEVLKYLKDATTKPGQSRIPIYVDPVGLQQAERSLDSRVIVDLQGVPLKTSLRLILKQLGMAYCVRDGVLIISSVQGIREELAEAAYELLGSGNEKVDMRALAPMGIFPRGGGMGGMGGMGGGMGGMGGGMRSEGMGGMGGGMM
jgi:RNA polymerase sigma factor (sigma-70 family)